MTETKATFAECTLQYPKNLLHRHMEFYGYKYIYKLTYFVPTQKSRNCSIDLTPKYVKISDFLSIFYSKPLRDF